MGRVNYHVTQNSITLNFDGKTLALAGSASVTKDSKVDRQLNNPRSEILKLATALGTMILNAQDCGEPRIKLAQSLRVRLLNTLRHSDMSTLAARGTLALLSARRTFPELADVNAGFEKDGFKLIDGVVIMPTGEALPAELQSRLLEFKREGLPFTHLLKFWENLKQNPSYRSREQLFKFLEHNGHPLTDDGCFIAYRGVTEDFKDKHTRTFDNSPGAVCEMPREQVNDDPTVPCSAGLHAAAWEYASNWSGTRVEVKINPKDVVSVPVDYNGQKMRVCRFEVIQVCEKPLENQALYGRENEHSEESYEDEDYFEDDDSEDTIDESTREDILHLADQHSQYDGEALVMRVCEDSFEDEETIRLVLEQDGRI